MVKQSKLSSAITVKGLRKSYGKLKVLRGINFNVRPGTILALLGPNGAGKTTTIRILSTLLNSDGGSARINGFDVAKQPDDVKSSIGLTGQYAAVDEYLSGEENLLMMGRLYRLSLSDTAKRTAELLELFGLEKAGKRAVKTYSGGMRRRLDLAMSLIASPPIIFLDEPTTGLDPRSRQTMWGMIKELAKSGTTILLTTQYMEEADQLADNIVVINDGKVIAEGTANKLKAKVGSDRLQIVLASKNSFEKAQKLISDKSLQIEREERTLSIASKGGARRFRELTKRLEDGGVDIESFSLHRPTLDDVFLTLTGHAAESTAKPAAKRKKKGKK